MRGHDTITELHFLGDKKMGYKSRPKPFAHVRFAEGGREEIPTTKGNKLSREKKKEEKSALNTQR